MADPFLVKRLHEKMAAPDAKIEDVKKSLLLLYKEHDIDKAIEAYHEEKAKEAKRKEHQETRKNIVLTEEKVIYRPWIIKALSAFFLSVMVNTIAALALLAAIAIGFVGIANPPADQRALLLTMFVVMAAIMFTQIKLTVAQVRYVEPRFAPKSIHLRAIHFYMLLTVGSLLLVRAFLSDLNMTSLAYIVVIPLVLTIFASFSFILPMKFAIAVYLFQQFAMLVLHFLAYILISAIFVGVMIAPNADYSGSRGALSDNGRSLFESQNALCATPPLFEGYEHCGSSISCLKEHITTCQEAAFLQGTCLGKYAKVSGEYPACVVEYGDYERQTLKRKGICTYTSPPQETYPGFSGADNVAGLCPP
ncbi:MAG: hypothetical protein ABIH41_05560 [Nanoarchaeota archaeon]